MYGIAAGADNYAILILGVNLVSHFYCPFLCKFKFLRFVLLLIHAVQEFLIILGLGELLNQQLHSLDVIEFIEDLPQNPDLLQYLLFQKQLFVPGIGTLYI